MLKSEKEYVMLVVLYKQRVTDSNTIVSYVRNCESIHKNTLLYIWDNSPATYENNLDFLKNTNIKFKYKHTPENVALSYIYNQVKQESSDKDLLFLFDQDSIIDNEYFDKVTSAAENNNDIALFMPYVKHNEMVVSPGRFFLYKGKYLKELKLGRLCSKNIIGITSGMAIVPDKIKFKFDENLKLYGIDSKFCLDYSDNFKYIYIVEYNLKHSLSKFEKEDKAVKLFRLKSEMNAMRYVTKNRSFIGFLLCCMATYMHLIIFKIKNLL